MNIHNLISGTCYLQAPLKAFELNDKTLKDTYGLDVKTIDPNNLEDLKIWVHMINNSYDDCQYNIEKAKELLTNH